ncbi:MAG: EscV/YscV/HrcV family type III secretion system export apparatus protein [Acidobacteria bacterium]|nr:EscV/YscV/HrcV family type III secretion system export apparatus protein [Acidobacteriota bacterium]
MIEDLKKQLTEMLAQLRAGNIALVLTQSADVILVIAVAAMVGLMIVPLPTFLLDIFLTVNITVALVVLMVSVYVKEGPQIASYPTLLLITTLYRLALDISTTRLILLQADAGEVVYSFGNFVVQGNFVVGAVIFLIITLVQFLVITKGAERVAEVAARFTLDAMPGKQMSIDADMRAGTISFEQARKRREALARESQFYGAMDGAMKFVKGDAIAGIIIVLINIIAGLIIGVMQLGMEVGEAVQVYSVLTIGSGLVSQIPALLIAISAGLVTTRVASEHEDSNLGKDVARQLLSQPKAIAIASGLLLVLAITPGLPFIPFVLMAAATGAIGYNLIRTAPVGGEGDDEDSALEAAKEPEIRPTAALALQVGSELERHVDPSTPEGEQFRQLLVQVRHALYLETGVILPPAQVVVQPGLAPNAYQIWAHEIPLASGEIRADAVLISGGASDVFLYGIRGEETRNPATGRPALWAHPSMRERAVAANLESWTPGEALVLHLTHFLREHAAEFLGPQEVQWMTDKLRQMYPTLVEEVTPKPVSLQALTQVLQRLAAEKVSIRDLKMIFEALSSAGQTDGDPARLTERVRYALRRRICYSLSAGKPLLHVYQLSPDLEDAFRDSIRESSGGAYLAMDEASIRAFSKAAQRMFGNLPATAQTPVILTGEDVRPFVRQILWHDFPEAAVLSYDQLTADINIVPLGTLEAAA